MTLLRLTNILPSESKPSTEVAELRERLRAATAQRDEAQRSKQLAFDLLKSGKAVDT